MASMEKSQESEGTGGTAGQEQAAGSKGKKAKEQKSAPQQRKQLSFIMPKLSDAELLKSLTPLKAITVHSASRALSVNASIASTLLKDLESKSMIRKAGGFSGHSIWAVAQRT
ncbi:MAG: 40S ribosomal protein S25 [Thaumarchaeota archaeon]|nr:40S ribosomal protein S25 [Nitrososphaerota archaeon]